MTKHVKSRLTCLLILLLLIKLGLLLYFPMPNTDGPWALSHTFSILNGHFFESNFAHSYMGFYNLPYMYGILNAPFYYLFTNTQALIYSIFLLNILWICASLLLVFKILRKQSDRELKFFLFAFAFVLSTYSYSLRPEIFLLPFLFWLQLLLNRYQEAGQHGWAICLLAATIGLVHPVGGFYAVFFISVYSFQQKIKFSKLVFLLGGIGIAVVALYGPEVLFNVQLWQLNFFRRGFENDTRHIDLSYPIKFYFYSIPFAALTIYTLWQCSPRERWKEVLYLFACISLLMLFMRSYYLPYLFHFVCWRLSIKTETRSGKWFIALYGVSFAAGILLCLGIPIYQLYDNNAYRNTFMDVLAYTKKVADRYPAKKIWVPSVISMNIVDQPGARLFVPNIEQLSGNKQVCDTNSIYLVHTRTDIPVIAGFEKTDTDSMTVLQVINPVKGLKRTGTTDERTDSIGLWEIKFVKKARFDQK